MKYKQLFIGAVIGVLAGILVGVVASNRYSITASKDTSIKLDKLTGRTWVYHWELGSWVAIPNR